MGDASYILVVDDDREIRRVLRQGLEAEGFMVLEAANKLELLRALGSQSIALVTLDLGLGQQDGLEIAREIRGTRNVPIVMITGRGEPLDRVTGLELGADDYIIKPFHIREVLLRIRTVLARYEIPGAAITDWAGNYQLAFSAFVFDPRKRELRTSDSRLVDLTETELNLLALFLMNPARVLSRDEIWAMLRNIERSPLDRTIDGHVARLRSKIEPPGEAPTFIKSVRGVGYVFTDEVRRV